MPLRKAALFLMIVGAEKGRGIIALMDDSEIKAVVPEIRRLTAVSREMQASVAAEFAELGYEDDMNPAEALTVIRLLFDGRRIRGGTAAGAGLRMSDNTRRESKC